MKPRTIGLLYASCSSLCWSIIAIAIKYTLDFASAGTIVWMRMLTASLCLIFFFSLTKSSYLKILWKPPWLGVLSALCLATNYFSYTKGIELTNASNTEIMIQLGPIILILAGVFYFKESLSWIQWGGIFIALFGFGCFYWEQISYAAHSAQRYFYGNLWIYFSACSWALFAVLQKKLSMSYPPQQLNILTYSVCAAVLFFTADLNVLQILSMKEYLILIALGLNTIIAYGALAEALKKAPATEVSFIIVLNPLMTIFLIQMMHIYGINIIEHEPLDWRGYLGAILVVSGISCALLIKKSRPLN